VGIRYLRRRRGGPWTDNLSRVKRLGLFAVILLVVVAALLIRDERADTAAGQAALQQYQQRTGRTDAAVGWTSRYGDCAVVALVNSGDEGLASIAVKRVGSVWVTGRSTEEGVSFDSDDVGSERECLQVADSSGPSVFD
jgi:hypothetical protein